MKNKNYIFFLWIFNFKQNYGMDKTNYFHCLAQM